MRIAPEEPEERVIEQGGAIAKPALTHLGTGHAVKRRCREENEEIRFAQAILVNRLPDRHEQKDERRVARGPGEAGEADAIEKLGQLMFGETWKPAKA